MASKDELSFLKGKHQSLTNNVLHTDKKSQYSNLNLNRNQNSSFLIPVQYPSNPKYDKYCAEEGAKKDWKKNGLSYANSSTLSFHISAYENSKETAGLVTLDGENVELKNLDNQLFPRLMIQTPFEFPRQQEEDQVTEPEVAEFRASQRLLGSAQPTSSNTARIPPVVTGAL
uniref:Uncharacterized protein n=1 Tax=Panagrolaimus davidi TaxID=227884 RepID=A0A914Q0A0_9BILA